MDIVQPTDIGDDNSSGDSEDALMMMMMMDQDMVACQKTDTCSR